MKKYRKESEERRKKWKELEKKIVANLFKNLLSMQGTLESFAKWIILFHGRTDTSVTGSRKWRKRERKRERIFLSYSTKRRREWLQKTRVVYENIRRRRRSFFRSFADGIASLLTGKRPESRFEKFSPSVTCLDQHFNASEFWHVKKLPLKQKRTLLASNNSLFKYTPKKNIFKLKIFFFLLSNIWETYIFFLTKSKGKNCVFQKLQSCYSEEKIFFHQN